MTTQPVPVTDEVTEPTGIDSRSDDTAVPAGRAGDGGNSPGAPERRRRRRPFSWGRLLAWAVMIVFLFITLSTLR